MNSQFYIRIFFLMGLLVMANVTIAQVIQSAHRKPDPTSYYFSLNQDNRNQAIAEVTGDRLSIKYEDRMGEDNKMVVQVSNWKDENIARFILNKSYGLNYYDIELSSLSHKWEPGNMYYCRYTNESGVISEIPFRLAKDRTKEGPEVNVFVNPIRLACGKDEAGTSSISFVGQIQGRAPFSLTWYVIDDKQTSLLYFPREEQIKTIAESSTITVDAELDYYVLLHVKDACGNDSEQMVHVRCDEARETINTLFVQPIRDVNRFQKTN